MEKYVIKTLKPEEYDRLPYKYATKSDGLADRMLGVCYIRDTGDIEKDYNTIIHEIEEMETDKWSHADEFGVRYSFGKSFIGKWLVPAALSFIPGVGPALAAGYGAMNNYQSDSSLKGAAMGALQGTTAGLGGQALAGGISGAFAGGTAAPSGFLSKASGIMSGFGSGLTSGFNTGMNNLPGIKGFGQGAAGAGGGSGLTGSSTLYGGAAPSGYAGGNISGMGLAGNSNAIQAGMQALQSNAGTMSGTQEI